MATPEEFAATPDRSGGSSYDPRRSDVRSLAGCALGAARLVVTRGLPARGTRCPMASPKSRDLPGSAVRHRMSGARPLSGSWLSTRSICIARHVCTPLQALRRMTTCAPPSTIVKRPSVNLPTSKAARGGGLVGKGWGAGCQVVKLLVGEGCTHAPERRGPGPRTASPGVATLDTGALDGRHRTVWFSRPL